MPPYEWMLKDYRDPVDPQPANKARIHMRRQLTAILPGYHKRINGVRVDRTAAHDKCEFKVDGKKMNLERAIDSLLRRERKPKPARIEAAKPPREFASVLGSIGDVATVQVALFEAA